MHSVSNRTEEGELLAAVTSRRLQAPALFLIEVVRPFHLLVGQALLLLDPLLRPGSGGRLLALAGLLQDDEAIERAHSLLTESMRKGT